MNDTFAPEDGVKAFFYTIITKTDIIKSVRKIDEEEVLMRSKALLITMLSLGLTCSAVSLTSYTNDAHAAVVDNVHETLHLTKKQQAKITKAFTKWVAERGQKSKFAVSNYYFDHGTNEDGKLWYAKTPDGDVLVRNVSEQDSSKDYRIKAIGGVVVYTAKNGTTGACNAIKQDTNNGATYSSSQVDTTKPIDKYLLADNGIIYKCKLSGDDIKPAGGFSIKGQTADATQWAISVDKDAQNEYRRLIHKYSDNTVKTTIDYNQNIKVGQDDYGITSEVQ